MQKARRYSRQQTAINPRAEIYAISRYPHQAAMAQHLGAREVIGEKDTYKNVARITGGRYIRGMLNNENIVGGFDIVYDSVGLTTGKRVRFFICLMFSKTWINSSVLKLTSPELLKLR